MAEDFDAIVRQAMENGLELDESYVAFLRTKNGPTAVQSLKKYVDVCASAKDAESIRSISIEAVWGTDTTTFKQPELCLNRDVAPSNKPKFETVDEKPAASKGPEHRKDENENKKPKVVRIARKAQIKDLPDTNWVPICDVKIPTRKRDRKLLLSELGIEWQENQEVNMKLEYANEARIQYLCVKMIKDVFKCLGLLPDEVTAHMEISIYTMRPDTILVLRRKGKIFFVVEVKNPELDDGEVFKNENVAAQICSYLLALEAMGDPCPIGAIMTYDKIALVTLKDYSNIDSFKSAMSKSKEIIGEGDGLPLKTTARKEKSCEGRNKPPIKTIRFVGDQKTSDDIKNERVALLQGKPTDQDGERDEDGDQVVNLEAHISEVKTKGEVFPFLLQAILVSYQKNTAVTDQVEAVEEGTNLGPRLSFKISAESFSWVRICQGRIAKIDYNVQAEETDRFCILGKLGEGRTGAVYLSANKKGNIYALKSYYLPHSKTGSDAELQQIWDDTREIAKVEASRWKTLYEDRRFNAVEMPLGIFPSILMPYGGDISPCNSEWLDKWKARFDKIADVKTELVRIGKKGFEYEKHDLRWSHVLIDKEDKIFFCDLGSFIEVDTNDGLSAEDRAYKQLEILLQPWSEEVLSQNVRIPRELTTQQCKDRITQDEILRNLLPVNDDHDHIVSLLASDSTENNPNRRAMITVCRWAIHWSIRKEESQGNDDPNSPSSNGGVSGTSSKENDHEMEDAAKESCAPVDSHNTGKRQRLESPK